MDQQVKTSSKVPLFNREDYEFWSVRMRIHLMYIGLEFWLSVETRYIYPKYPPIGLEEIKKIGCNAKDVNAILDRLARIDFSKVMHCKTTKDIWDKLDTIYEGDIKVKRAKLHNFKTQFESLKLKEEENISKYFERIDEIVNAIQGLGA